MSAATDKLSEFVRMGKWLSVRNFEIYVVSVRKSKGGVRKIFWALCSINGNLSVPCLRKIFGGPGNPGQQNFSISCLFGKALKIRVWECEHVSTVKSGRRFSSTATLMFWQPCVGRGGLGISSKAILLVF